MKVTLALAYVALLLWIGWLGIEDRGADWSTVAVVLFWLLWLGASPAVGIAFARADALWLPVAVFLALIAYAMLWPDGVSNEVWLLNLGFEMVVSVVFVGLGIAVGRRQPSRRSAA